MPQRANELATKVAEITLLFWVVKVLTTGMGEAMSDFMGQQSVPIAGAIGVLGFTFALRRQLRAPAYSAPTYRFAVLMVAVFGTMVADGIKDGLGLSYAVTTPVFAVCVGAVFWLSYILTRPLGASIADWFGKPGNGGLGLGDGTVSAVALVAFAALVAYLTAGRRDARRRPLALRPQAAED